MTRLTYQGEYFDISSEWRIQGLLRSVGMHLYILRVYLYVYVGWLS